MITWIKTALAVYTPLFIMLIGVFLFTWSLGGDFTEILAVLFNMFLGYTVVLLMIVIVKLSIDFWRKYK